MCVLIAFVFSGCAQVPKESVELSATVGRDIESTYQAHRELGVLLFEQMENDVNKFVDDVYAPYQISALLSADQEDFKKGNSDSLFFTLDAAVRRPDDAQAQKDALAAMEAFVEVVREVVEEYRAEKLKPVKAQRQSVLSAIDQAYNQIIFGNATVTAYLSSVVKVRGAQDEILAKIGVEDLQTKVGVKLAETSNKLAEFNKKAKRVDGRLEDVEPRINALTEELDRILNSSD
jgi:hypothetical protein